MPPFRSQVVRLRVRGLVRVGVMMMTTALVAQQAPYSRSHEYQQMMDEVRSPAPSPAYVATGRRPESNPSLQVRLQEDERTLQVASSSAEYTLDKTSGAVTIRNTMTKTSWTLKMMPPEGCAAAPETPVHNGVKIQRDRNTWTMDLQTSCGQTTMELELMTDSLARLTTGPFSDAKTSGAKTRGLQWHVEGGGPYFGLGERFWQAGLSGTTLDVRPQDRYGEPGHAWTYVAIPLVYGVSGLGLYADTAFDTDFRFNQADSSFDLRSADAPVPIYLFTEPNPKAVLTAYTAITGRPQNPPLWTFGPWITALQGKGPVLDVAHHIRTTGMPASALWIYDQNDEADNLGWPFWFSSYYGDPRTFVDTLHGQGFKVLTYVHPYLRAQILPYTTTSPEYAKGVTDKLLVMGADGRPAGPRFELVPVGNVDFTNPQAVDWWQGMITSAVQKQGFDGWMEDFGEWIRDTDRLAAGTGRTLSELYPLLYHKITLRIAQAINPEVVPFSRSGSPGSQQFSPVLWGADQSANWTRDYGLPSVVTAGITAGMSGFSTWGPDILSTGGSKELWMRWVEFGALTPVMRDHVWNKPDRSFNLFTDADTEAHFRRWAAFHSALLPYFATYAAEASRTGVPIMRHTVLEYPEDPRAAAAEYQYLLGREILVAPVVQPSILRTLYLPPGEWVNFWNGDFLHGGQDVTLEANVDTIPILVKAGSILPFKPEEEAGRWSWDDPELLASSLLWKGYLSESGLADTSFTLPNGTSAHFEQHDKAVAITGKSKTTRDYEVIVRTSQPPTSVVLNGTPFAAYSKASAGKPVSQWWWNPSSFELHMRFRAADFQLEMTGMTSTQYTN